MSEQTDVLGGDVINSAMTIAVEVPADLASIAVARSVVRRVVTFRDDDATSSFLVALTEILGNAIDEHERIGSTDPVTLEVVSGNVDVVRVIDQGTGIDLDVLADHDPTVGPEASERGRGLTIARAFIADLAFESSESGTTVTLPLTRFGIVR